MQKRAVVGVVLALSLACESTATVEPCATSSDCPASLRCVDRRCVVTPDAASREDGGDSPDAGHDAADGRLDDASLPRAYELDLDHDGTPETDLDVAPCAGAAAGGALCLLVERSGEAAREIALTDAGRKMGTGGATITGHELRVIGDHVGSATDEVAVAFLLASAHDTPALAVIDVAAGSVVARASGPTSLPRFLTYALAAYVAYPEGAAGRITPVLAPGYGDEPGATWGYACAFSPTATSSARCGAGWIEISTVPTEPGWFREVGGYLYDADLDGTDDLHLLFHQRVLTFSPRTGALLASTTFDVASIDEPGAPQWFHSGRNYGTHSARVEASGHVRTLMVGGAPVGTFADANCNVSRFVAALSQDPGAPVSRTLAWSDYFGFASSIFVRYDPAYADMPEADLARIGDFVDGCVHRFSDSRTTIDGTDAAIFDVFDAEGPVDACLDEQYQLYLPPAWTDEKARIWYACFGTNVGSMGRWGMQARRVADGASVTGSLDTYVWGRSDRLLPTGEMVYLVEQLPGRVRFDLADVAPSALHVWSLVAGLWTVRGVLPIAGRPAIVSVEAEGAIGVGSFTGLAELDLRDVDGDGLLDAHLADGTWVGFDAASGAFVVR